MQPDIGDVGDIAGDQSRDPPGGGSLNRVSESGGELNRRFLWSE